MERDEKLFLEKECVCKKESFYLVIAIILTVTINTVILGASIMSGLIIIVVYLILAILFAQGLMIAHIQQNSVEINENQFSDIHKKISDMSLKMHITEIPKVYLMESGGCLNAFATRFMFKNYVVLYSDILEMAYDEGENAVDFVIAHELAHIKRNHMGKRIWTLWGEVFPYLGSAYSRACETTCDNMAITMVQGEVSEGLLLLQAGKKLYKKVNVKEMLDCAHKTYGLFAWFSEIGASHPHIAKRIENIAVMNKKLYNVDSDLVESCSRFKMPTSAKVFMALFVWIPLVSYFIIFGMMFLIMLLNQG